MESKKWRRVNLVLLGLIISVNLFTIVAPLLPELSYNAKANGKNSVAEKPVDSFIKTNKDGKTNDKDNPPPEKACEGNCLFIPRMMLATPLVEGPEKDSEALLKKGVWRLPFSTTPDKGGNTVLAAHRFSYTGPRGLFYFLNKLKNGDEIGIRWEGKLYKYRVESSQEVPPTAISIQQPTIDTRLTLYTCTPLYNPTNRLVVVAKPINAEETP